MKSFWNAQAWKWLLGWFLKHFLSEMERRDSAVARLPYKNGEGDPQQPS